MPDYMHVVLVVQVSFATAQAFYSRHDSRLNRQEIWEKHSQEVKDFLGKEAILVAVVEDREHRHPPVIVRKAGQPVFADPTAHMP